MENFSSYLKIQREKKGIRLEEIASITKIHLHSLELLESSQWDKLPPEPFIRGFITAYAKYVGLDAKDTLAKYYEEIRPRAAVTPAGDSAEVAETPEVKASPQPSQKHRSPTPKEKQKRPKKEDPQALSPTEVMQNVRSISSRKVAFGVSATAAIVAFLIIIRVGKYSSEGPMAVTPVASQEELSKENNKEAQNVLNAPAFPSVASATTPSLSPQPSAGTTTPAETVAPPVQKLSETTAAVVAASAPSPGPSVVAVAPREVASPSVSAPLVLAPPADPQMKHEVVIEGKERTWIKVVVDDADPIEYFLPEGQKATYKAKDKIKVVLGNSTGTVVTHNGEEAPGTKFQGTIRSYIFPQDSRFPQDVPAKRATTSTSDDTTSDTQ